MPVDVMPLPKRWGLLAPGSYVGGGIWGAGNAYGGAGGPDAVEHVCAEGDGDDEIFWVAL